MASSLTLVRVVAVLGFSTILLLQGCSSLKLGGYAGENYQIEPPYSPDTPVNTGNYDYHVVQRGESVSSIAQRYGKDWRELASLNNLRTPYTLEVGQRLLVAGGVTAYPTNDLGTGATTPMSPPPLRSQPVPPSSGTYTVQPGDTVYSLARRAGYSVSQLMSWNGLTAPQSLRVGQRFWLSPPSSSNTGVATTSPYTIQRVALPAVTTSVPPPSSSTSHVVVGGDTLYNVARRYGNTPEQIAAWNKLSPPYRLTIGSVLRVSATGTSQMRSLNYSAPVKSASRYHTVSRGQTVYSIARMYGCSEYELLVNNRLSKPILHNKQKLDVSNCANRRSDATPYNTSLVAQSLPSSGVGGNLVFHTVRAGETLEDIAKLYGITSHELALSNGIGSPYTVFPGHRLKITSR